MDMAHATARRDSTLVSRDLALADAPARAPACRSPAGCAFEIEMRFVRRWDFRIPDQYAYSPTAQEADGGLTHSETGMYDWRGVKVTPESLWSASLTELTLNRTAA